MTVFSRAQIEQKMGEKFSEDCLNPDCGEVFEGLVQIGKGRLSQKEKERHFALYDELRVKWIQIAKDSFVRVVEATREQWEANDAWRDEQWELIWRDRQAVLLERIFRKEKEQ
jgi:hypothetical protein